MWLQEDWMTHTSPFICYEPHPATPAALPALFPKMLSPFHPAHRLSPCCVTPTDAGATDWPGKGAPTPHNPNLLSMCHWEEGVFLVLLFILMCTGILPLYMSLYHGHAQGSRRGHWILLGLELQVFQSHHMALGTKLSSRRATSTLNH